MAKKRKKKFSAPKAHDASTDTEQVIEIAAAVPEASERDDELPDESECGPRRKNREISVRVAFLVLGICGILTFAWGLGNGFVLDDTPQITDSALVHSLAHLPQVFSKQTFVTSKGLPSLAGIYYRPLMLLAYAFVYTVTGATPWAFHLLQLLLYIGSSWLLFLVLRNFFRTEVALGLSLIFLVDPVNSQSVYYIADLQEPLFFFFGLLGLWTYMHWQDKPNRYLLWTGVSLFLSLLAKESGIMFLAIILIYAWITGRKRFWALVKYLIAPFAVYFALRFHALGLGLNHHIAPIDSLNFTGRLINMPATVWFYIEHIFWPWKLVVYYYAVVKSASLTGFILPIIGDVVFLGLIVYCYRYLKKRQSSRDALVFWFFALWFLVGLVPTLQIIPLDMTTSDSWLLVPLVGFLGMVGTLFESVSAKVNYRVAVAVTGAIIIAFGIRSAMRAPDWQSESSIVNAEISNTSGDFVAESILANTDANQNEPASAYNFAKQSIAIYPAYDNYAELAHAEFEEGDYKQANADYLTAINYRPVQIVLDQMAELQLYYTDPNQSLKNVQRALYLFPNDGVLWTTYAMLNYKLGNLYVAQDAILRAYAIHGTNSYAKNAITNSQSVDIDIMGHEQVITPSAAALANPGGQEQHSQTP
jgi:hypothetical protein